MDKPSVFIALPSYRGEFAPLMTQSLERLLPKMRDAGIFLGLKKEFSSIIPLARNTLVDKAMRGVVTPAGTKKFTHLLFIDSDMVFNDDALLKLLAFDRDVIGVVAVARGEPYVPCVKKINDKGEWKTHPNIESIVKDGRFASDCDGIGTGFMLIKMSVFDTLKKPYFAMPPLGESVMGEDMYFCAKAKKAGYDICVDGSLTIGHIGEHVYTMDDFFAYKEAYDAQEKEKANGQEKEKANG